MSEINVKEFLYNLYKSRLYQETNGIGESMMEECYLRHNLTDVLDFKTLDNYTKADKEVNKYENCLTKKHLSDIFNGEIGVSLFDLTFIEMKDNYGLKIEPRISDVLNVQSGKFLLVSKEIYDAPIDGVDESSINFVLSLGNFDITIKMQYNWRGDLIELNSDELNIMTLIIPEIIDITKEKIESFIRKENYDVAEYIEKINQICDNVENKIKYLRRFLKNYKESKKYNIKHAIYETLQMLEGKKSFSRGAESE